MSWLIGTSQRDTVFGFIWLHRAKVWFKEVACITIGLISESVLSRNPFVKKPKTFNWVEDDPSFGITHRNRRAYIELSFHRGNDQSPFFYVYFIPILIQPAQPWAWSSQLDTDTGGTAKLWLPQKSLWKEGSTSTSTVCRYQWTQKRTHNWFENICQKSANFQPILPTSQIKPIVFLLLHVTTPELRKNSMISAKFTRKIYQKTQ